MKENQPKIDNLMKENEKLNFEVGFEINREDELKGELIILKNQYEILFNQLSEEEIKIKQYQDIIKHKHDHEKIITNKQNEIIDYYNNLNECLTKGEILLVTKPDIYDRFNYLNIKNIEPIENSYPNQNNSNDNKNNNNEENNVNKDNVKQKKNEEMDLQTNLKVINEIDDNNEIDNYLHYDTITLLLKGYFINMNIKNIDDLVNKIWIYEKPLQTFESLTEELLILIDNYISDTNSTFINEHNRNIIMNYLYSFCICYNYMTKNEFISIFNDKLGYFIEFNENYLMSKLYKYCNGKLSEFIKVVQDLDKKKTGIIDIHELIKNLKAKNIIINNKYNDNLNLINEKNLMEQNDVIDIMQLLIIDMKKNKIILENGKDSNDNKDNNTQRKDNLNENKRKVNIYELYYESIINIINENNKSKMPIYK